MPELHVRRVGKGLLRDINIAALKAEQTQREWILDTLERRLGHGGGEEDSIESRVDRIRKD